MYAYIGSRTSKQRHARGEGISLCEIDSATGTLTVKKIFGDLINPSYLAISHSKQFLYVVHGDSNEVSAFAIDPGTGDLRLIDRLHCGGRNPVHLALSANDEFLIVSNHLTSNIVSIALLKNGAFGRIVDNVNLVGQVGCHRIEQPFAKPHFNGFDRSHKFIIVPDKGLDSVFCFGFEQGKFIPTQQANITNNKSAIENSGLASREGAGPRHFIQHPHADIMYVVNELDSTVVTYQFDSYLGRLTPIQNICALDSDFVGNSRAAAIILDKQGKYLYTSNRGADSISLFTIDPITYKLRFCQAIDTLGKTPRFITLSPDNRYLYALNEDSHSIVCFEVNNQTGTLSNPQLLNNIGSPVCLVFLD